MKVSILLGAGASYGCGYTDLSKRPPLGIELFDKLVKEYPDSWGKYVPRNLISTFRSDFELGMAQAWESKPKYFSQLLIDMAIFFTRFNPPDKNDLYSSLLKNIANAGLLSKCGFISLNYECVFEIAASRLGLRITMNSNAPAPGNILMWKPHGSCNFIPDIQVFNLTLQLTGLEQQYYEGRIKVLGLRQVRELYLGKLPLAIPPAISLYVPGKTTLTAKGYIKKVRESMTSWVNSSNYIITIGARPNLADEHVWGPIISSKALVRFVGGRGKNTQQLKEVLGDRFDFVGEKFQDTIDTLNTRIRLLF